MKYYITLLHNNTCVILFEFYLIIKMNHIEKLS